MGAILMSRYYDFQTLVHTMSGTLNDTGVEEEYKVSRAADGHWECSCKAWIFGRKYLYNGTRYKEDELDRLDLTPNGVCKHAMWVINNQSRINTAVSLGGNHRIEDQGFYVEIKDGRLVGFLSALSQ